MGASTTTGTLPPVSTSTLCPTSVPNSRPPGESVGTAAAATKTTTAMMTAATHSHGLCAIPQLGNFSRLNLDTCFASAVKLPDHPPISKSSETIITKPSDPPSPQTEATKPATAISKHLPYNILKVPKLGNFSSLEISSVDQSSMGKLQDDPGISAFANQQTVVSGNSGRVALGDFSKIFEPLGYYPSSSKTASSPADIVQSAGVSAVPQIPQSEPRKHGDKTATGCIKTCSSPRTVAREPEDLNHNRIRQNSSSHEIEFALRSSRLSPVFVDSDGRSLKSSPGPSGYETGVTTPPQSPALALSDNSQQKTKGPSPASPSPGFVKSTNDAAFEYSLDDSSSRSVVKKWEVQRKLENFRKRHSIEKYCHTCRTSEHEYCRDRDVNRLCPGISGGAVHIFADVSNIFISLLHTVKKALNIPSTAKIYPNPDFDWRKLVEIASRGRPITTLKAGCSINPERGRNPAFIQRLEDAGFNVRVRDRVQNQEGRWVEKLVDESIQVDIGDCVEQNKENKGTIIIVTGDGKPAEQSSGFIRYAKYALSEGWHVEVICWDVGCSQAWKDESWEQMYGERYCLTSLDSYLGDLWDKDF